ncbi:MAG: NAD(P)/FAD-dependent oxidoreductase [bacterium]|nr:NAD(P)/FAD-dependent oxidoreductase [bacterium]
MSDPYDVVIIGGGPAGTTLATLVQRRGYRCLILERATFPRYHIGESLIPATYGTLDRLGLLPKLRASSFPVKHSVRFVSADGRRSTPFYFSETIDGEGARTWQVERSEFDEMCLDNARGSGVGVRTGTSVRSVRFEDGRAVGVRARTAGADPYEIDSRVVADASGHAAVIGSQLGLRSSVHGLEKGSLWGYYKGGKRLAGIDAGETTIFTIPRGGWFWYIPLPNDIVSVGIVDDPRHLFTGESNREQSFLLESEACRPLQERLIQAERVGPIRGSRRLAYVNRQTCGDGWLMLGDARAFLDPIYSSGLYLALASAELAAGCVCEALAEGDCSVSRLDRFEPPLMAGVDVIWRLILAFYDTEFSFRAFLQRFPEQRGALINCLVGDVLDKDLSEFKNALAQMTVPPQAGLS